MRETVSSLPHLMYEDLAVAAPVIGWCAGAAIAFGFVWLLLLRLLAGYMVWATLAAAAVGMGAAAWWLWTTQESMKASPLYGADDLHTQQADGSWSTAVVPCESRPALVDAASAVAESDVDIDDEDIDKFQ